MLRAFIATCLLSFLILGNNAQFPGFGRRYRNPRIEQYYNYRCRNLQCNGIEDVCEIRPYPCLIPPCPEGPTCVPTPGSATKNGRCPWFVFAYYPRCNTDYGCYGDQICCHGRYGSRCVDPIPDFTIG